MRTHLSRLMAVVGVASLALLTALPVRAVTVPLVFTGTQQNFNGSLGASGSLKISGTALFLTFPSQTIPFSLAGTPSVTSDPTSNNLPDTGDLVAPNTNNLVDINSLDLDMLNGQTTNFKANTLNINAIPFPVTLDVSGTLSGLTFSQTGAATLATILAGPVNSNGTFSVDGNLTATLSNLQAVLGAFGSPLYTLTIAPTNLTNSFPLSGTWKSTAIGFGQRKIELDGSTTLSVPLSLVSTLVSTASTINLAIDLLSTINVAVGYHLETITVPEPGSIALLGVGLCAALGIVPIVRRRRK
ncbi:MAG: PEP-CTERM sorting domain-containing protein [Pirellulales bacterium]|nr:PEP-CTERM sorting domain-containing protein [Pirellulales bacterium]